MPPTSPIIQSAHVCPAVTVIVPHVGGPILGPGAPTVIVGGVFPNSVVGDIAICIGPPSTVVKGSATVLMCKKPAARIGDNTAHGGVIVSGLPTVIVGG